MRKHLKNFVQSDSGAVTVDFIMLSSAVVGLGVAVLLVVSPGIKPNADNVNPHANGAATMGASLING